MNSTIKSQLCSDIANIIKDYRNLDLNCNHVEKWINQFKTDEQEIVLLGTFHLFQKLYFSEDDFNKYIIDVIDYLNRERITDYSLLNCQINGTSQKELNDKFRNIINNVKVDILHENLIYLDDFIFTGNRIFQDIKRLLESNPNFAISSSCCTINICTLGWYSYGCHKLEKELELLSTNMQRNIYFKFASYEGYRFNNNPNDFDKSDTFTTPHNISENIKTDLESKLVGKQRLLFRCNNDSEIAFKDFEFRDKFEEILIKYGIDILEKCNNTSLKPLGFGDFQPGFGATVFTYRNCPNNAPLVYWWGSLTKTDNPALQWYPLLPRTIYAPTS